MKAPKSLMTKTPHLQQQTSTSRRLLVEERRTGILPSSHPNKRPSNAMMVTTYQITFMTFLTVTVFHKGHVVTM
jgi:hypothetical protein